MKHHPAALAATLSIFALTATALGAAPAMAVPAGHGKGPTDTAEFTLQAEVHDGGEQVTSVTIEDPRLRTVDPASLSESTFTVHAEGSYPEGVDLLGTSPTAFAVDRTVTGASVTASGDIRLDLESAWNLPGGGTLSYLAPAGRNITLDLDYTIEQTAPLQLRNGSELDFDDFEQNGLASPEVDAFDAGVSADGLNYRLRRPDAAQGQRPLIVWLHGNGEGGHGEFYDNEPQLRANRGAVGPATAEAQEALGGAYVLAPQVPDTWYNSESAGYEQKLRALIDEVAQRERIDADRIHIMGASAGGLMATRLVSAYPQDFASAIITCPAYVTASNPDRQVDAEDIERLAETPTWFIHSEDDPTVPFEETSQWAHDLLPDSILSSYDSVSYDGVDYPGHWSWIYTARNAPEHDGTHLWEWMAEQSR